MLEEDEYNISIAILDIRVQTSRWRSFQFLLSRLGACVGATVFAQNPKHDHCSYSRQTILTYYLQCTSNLPRLPPPNPPQLPVLRSPHLPANALIHLPNQIRLLASSMLRPPSAVRRDRIPHPIRPPFLACQRQTPACVRMSIPQLELGNAPSGRDGGEGRAAGAPGRHRWTRGRGGLSGILCAGLGVGQRPPFLGYDGAADWLEGDERPVRGIAHGVPVRGMAAAKASGLL